MKYFRYFANCLPVKGAYRSILCDLQRRRIKFIPNLLYSALELMKSKTVDDVKLHFENQYDKGIDQYLAMLVEQEWGWWSDEPRDWFPEFPLNFDFPAAISNAIIDIDEKSNYDVALAINEIQNLGCHTIQIRCFSELPLSNITDFLALIKESRLKSVGLILKYSEETSQKNLLNIRKIYPRVMEIAIHSAPVNIVLTEKELGMKMVIIQFFKNKITDHTHCGKISKERFNIDIQMFTESLKFNSCLNKKISIDVEGNIKNCPSMSKSYGNIKNTTLSSVLAIPEFKNYWSINKDQIEICKDCEFRYICLDCRAFIENKENIYSKPLKCSYNPYNATWEL